jgi:hypothetical protein
MSAVASAVIAVAMYAILILVVNGLRVWCECEDQSVKLKTKD